MTAKVLTFILSFNLFAAASASAVTYVEDFEAAFPAWQSGWLGMNSNLKNHLALNFGEDRRDGNPDGLWIDDGDGLTANDTVVEIRFGQLFGSSLTSLSVDVATYIPGLVFQIFDIQDNKLISESVFPTGGVPFEPGVYVNFFARSKDGIGGFRFNGMLVEGNTSIDNVIASTDPIAQVPDSASTFLLVGLGLATLATFRRRRVR